MAASPSRLRQRSGSTPHDALTVDRRSSPHQPLSQPLDRQCTHSCQAINFAPSQIANVASQHHVSSCVAVRAGKTNSQTASIHAHQVSRRGQIPIAFAAPHRTPHRDFVPWRFLVAGRISTWIAQSCRRPKTCTIGNKVQSNKRGRRCVRLPYRNSVAYLRAIALSWSLVLWTGGTPGRVATSRKKALSPGGATTQRRRSSRSGF